LLIAVCIKFDSAGPVFFRQERVGFSGKLFKIHKFRTMAHRPEGKSLQITVAKDRRVTEVGQLLRKYKLDELPQLIDVVRGDMSLVGPRPEVPKYVAHYPDSIKRVVLSVRPGITDLAAIEYKDEGEILAGVEDPERHYVEHILPAKLGYYTSYVLNRTCWTDLVIIAKTLRAVSSK
jgi:lipopolysaccharide/colanic/teichoic acid biosynthesis glycosyltransferase